MSKTPSFERNASHDPRAIANRILDLREETGSSLTLMQLIKLIYIADGWSLALLGRPLSNEAPEAWQYGPVFRSVYNCFAGIGSSPVTTRAMIPFAEVPYAAEFSEAEKKIIEMVVRGYGKLSAFALSNLTHEPNTPWSKAFARGRYSDIDTKEMHEHFESLKEKRLVQRA